MREIPTGSYRRPSSSQRMVVVKTDGSTRVMPKRCMQRCEQSRAESKKHQAFEDEGRGTKPER